MSEEQVINVAPEAPEAPIAVVTLDQDTTEPAPEAPVAEPTPQDDLLPKPDKSQSKFDKRIAQLNRKIGEEKAKSELLAKQVEELRPKPEVKSDGIRIEDFDFDVEKFAEAKAKAAEESAFKRFQEEQQTRTQKQAIERLQSDWDSKISRAESKYDDFDEVVGELKPNSYLNIAIMQAENGEDIAHYLGKNREEAKRLANLDPVAAIREIGRLEAKLLSEPPKVSAPSNAPAPITPVKGSSSATRTIFDTDSQDEFDKLRRKQIANR